MPLVDQKGTADQLFCQADNEPDQDQPFQQLSQIAPHGGESVKLGRGKTEHRVDAEEQSIDGEHSESADDSPANRARPALAKAEPAPDASVPRGSAEG